MTRVVARMVCPMCEHRWEAQAVKEDDSAYLVLDDLCPECEAQGEPTELVPPGRSDPPPGENFRVHYSFRRNRVP